MIKTAAFVIIIALRLIYQPTAAQQRNTPFASPQPLSTVASTNIPAMFMGKSSIKINNKIILKWIIGDNQDAWCFEVEKSSDGKNFTTAALVSGTDKSDRDNYEFYEKAGNRRVTYRIKLVSKNKTAEYSQVVEINPNV